jgi:Tfp pilus assembly protein PilF
VNAIAWIDYATVLLQQQAMRSANARDWKSFESALAEAKGLAPEDASLMLLEADYESMHGRATSAAQLLQKVEVQPNLSAVNSRRLALAYERSGKTAAANRIYKQLQSQATPATALDTLLLGVDLLANRGNLEKAAQLITSSVATLGEADRLIAQYRLADLLMASGQRDQAQTLLLDMVQRSPREARALQQVLDLSLATTEPAQLERWIDQLKKLEGADGTQWRFYRAQWLLRAVREQPKSAGNAAKIAEARQLQAEIQKLRPAWPLGYLLLARLHQLPGAADDTLAADAYRQAVQLGDRQVGTFEELLSVLYRQGRIADAAAYLEYLEGANNLSPSLTTLSLAIDARQGNFTRAIESARQFVAREPKRADARLQLGQLLLMDRNRPPDEQNAALAEAEREFERATELAPENVDAWSMRLALYIGTKRTDAARALLARLQESSQFKAPERALFLAQSYAMLGDASQAQKWYRDAIAVGAERADIQRDAAKFFAGVDSALAEQCARKALQLDPAHKEARRLLATLLIDRGGQAEELSEVWKLIDSSVQGSDSTDRRLEAIFLLRRGGADNRKRARKIFEALIAEGGSAAPIDRLLLSQICEAEGDVDAAREQLLVLVSHKSPAPAHLTSYAELLLRLNRVQDAVAVIDQLAAVEPESASLRTLSLRVQSLKALKDDNQVAKMLESFLKKNLTTTTPPGEQVQLLLAVGNLCAAAELAKPAENCFRRALKLDPKAYGGLARWLANTDRMHESIRVCVAASEHDTSAQPAISLISFMLTRKLSEADRSLAEGFLDKTLQAHPQDGRLLQAMGTLRLLQGRRADAIKYLRETLALDPRNLDALNNLALLLSEEPSTQEESVRFIDRALAIAGASPELLDSKGWILLKQQKLAEAAAMFLEALSLPPGDPRHRFHLAVAYHLQGKRTEARESLAAARENKLPVELLSPEERDQLAKLEAELK